GRVSRGRCRPCHALPGGRACHSRAAAGKQVLSPAGLTTARRRSSMIGVRPRRRRRWRGESRSVCVPSKGTSPMERRLVTACAVVLIATSMAAAQAKRRPMKLDDLFAFERLSEPQVSPDGKHVVYVAAKVDLSANKTSSSLWLAPASGKG